MLRRIPPPVDNPPKPWPAFAQALNRAGTGQAGVRRYFNGGTTGFARGAPKGFTTTFLVDSNAKSDDFLYHEIFRPPTYPDQRSRYLMKLLRSP